jgi:hypothetical protein
VNTVRSIVAVGLLGLSLTACGSNKPEPKQEPGEESSVISEAVGEAIVEARKEIKEGNISVSHQDGQPKAEITPKGDLLIDGKAVAVNAEQRALLLEYRGQIAAVAEAGTEIGMHASDLAAKAVGEALKGVFTGKSEQEIERSVEAKAGKVKAAAAALCTRLPAMMASQQKLAAALPEFKPYATMTQQDIDDCEKDGKFDIDAGTVASDVHGAAQDAAHAAHDAADAAKEAADAAKEAADAAREAAEAAKN